MSIRAPAPYRQPRRLVFTVTLLVAIGLVAGFLAVRGTDAPGGGAGPQAPTIVGAAAAPTTTAAASSAATAAGGTPAGLTGVWKGEATQRSLQTSWTISMALQPGRRQGIAGVIAYPSLACGGHLTMESASGSEVRLREKLTFGTGSCVDGGLIMVRQSAAGRLDWKWYQPDGTLDAETTLTRTRPSAGAVGVVSPRLAGIWTGEGHQFSDQSDWTISMALQPGRTRRVAGLIAYPSLECGGELILLSASKSEVRLREKLSYGTGGCVDGGSIIVRAASGGRLDWKYYLPEGEQDAESTLQRLG